MIRSMTAYADAEIARDELSVAVEIRSYNSRHLDMKLRWPGDYYRFEDDARKLVTRYIQRGRIEIRVTVACLAENATAYFVDDARAKAYLKALNALKSELQLKTDISIDLFTGNSEIIKPVPSERNVDAEWPLIHECLEIALQDLNTMRIREGDYIAADFRRRLETIEQWIKQIEDGADNMLIHYQKRLTERIATLTDGAVTLDPERLAQEVAVLAVKSDISEEIVRARSHVRQFRTIMDGEDNVGPKLNFLLQEFNREFNTMGAKTADTELSYIVVDVKAELEKIREQVQNVE